ncbi:MAG: sigma-54 interaction domain-containing protein [Fastidiosipilaceae bacterium]|jgi:transcriptional regulator with PAS, ATPase and Fis domain
MNELMDIQNYAQQIAEAIAAVLGIDVEIADKKLVRVAGTGIYRDDVGRSMERQGFIYQEVMRLGHEVVIDNPGKNKLCQLCEQKEHCPEKYEIVYPINVDSSAAGVIGLLCFDEERARVVRQNQESYLAFLGKMAETLALKIKEEDFLKGLVYSYRYLKSIIDCLEEGLITTDLNGKVMHYNKTAQTLLGEAVSSSNASLGLLLGSKRADEIINIVGSKKKVLEKEMRIDAKPERLHLMIHARPITTEKGVQGIAIALNQFTKIRRLVNRYSSTSSEINYTVDDILGVSKPIQQLREKIKSVASSNSTVLIRGESGTGKELVARAIHNYGAWSQGPFVAINCSAIPESLLESELFGYEDGAFTGARKGGKMGKFELADQGTLFLDEIGDMAQFLQVKLLRVLQERRIERIGGLYPIPVDVRVIAATNRDLEKMIAQGEFREDLYYRINVIPITIAPLRERKDDIDVLCEFFIDAYNKQLDKNVQKVSKEFRRKLYEYSWPGNVRELQNAIEYAMNLADGDFLDVKHLPVGIREVQDEDTVSFNLELLERRAIHRCLQQYGTTVEGKQKAAKELGIGIATLYRKMKRYGIKDIEA